MARAKEILNIDYHKERYVTEALIRSKGILEASKLLEVSERSVFRYMDRYEIDYKEIKRARKLRNSKEKYNL